LQPYLEYKYFDKPLSLCYTAKKGEETETMQEHGVKKLKLLIGVITALLFVVVIFAFFSLSENDYVANYHKFQNVLANANPVKGSSSSGLHSFNRKSSDESEFSGDSQEQSNESESSSEKISSSTQESSSAESDSYNESSSHKESSSSSASSSSQESSSASQNPETDTQAAIPILGENVLTKQQLLEYCASYSEGMKLTCSLDELIGYYLSIGEKYGLRGDIAFLQAINETGWFRYNRPNSYLVYRDGKWVRIYEPRPEGLYVIPEYNNFCGLGVTGRLGDEESICKFETAALGVEAQIQHLYAYACTLPLPSGTTLIDPRFKFVSRGCSPNWDDLGNGNWATSSYYSTSILSQYYKILAEY